MNRSGWSGALAALLWMTFLVGCTHTKAPGGAAAITPCPSGGCVENREEPSSPEIDLDDLEERCEEGHTVACNELGLVLEDEELAVARRAYRRSCDLGDPYGCGNLGLFLLRRAPPTAPAFEASRLFETACKGRVFVACRNLGVLIVQRRAHLSLPEAPAFLSDGCDGGDVESCSLLGELYLHGNGVRRNPNTAWRLFELSCEGGYGPGCGNLALTLEQGLGTPKDLKRAVALYETACDVEHVRSCSNLGVLKGKEGNFARAKELYEWSCNRGMAIACINLGTLYQKGRGVEESYQEARRLFLKACSEGVPQGCAYAGNLEDPTGKAARDQYWRACDGGDLKACRVLGTLLENTRPRESASLYRKVCEEGFLEGCTNLGVLYQNGLGVRENLQKARQIFQKACDKGEILACNNLGGLAMRGAGGPLDPREARRVLEISCDAGHAPACYNLGFLLHTLNPASSEAAERYGEACRGEVSQGCEGLVKILRKNTTLLGESLQRELFELSCSRGYNEFCDAVRAP